ncbi:MAG TPA: GAF domain-containing sensor histidine kinase [Ktedonobacterales bacterium]|nr:GAF domain-containing sensor histidine kinase [Ktedonobacterales bacterium]
MGSTSDAEKLKQLNRELSILNSIAQALNGSAEMAEALNATLGRVAELLGLETGWIWLLDESTGENYLGAAQNLPRALTKNPRRMSGSCYCLDTYREGDLAGAANVNVVKCSRLSGLVDDTNGLRYHASIPLYAHGKKLGVMNVASTDWRELSQDDLRLLYTVGDMVSIAIERARLFAQSVRLGAVEERNRLAREIHDTLAQGLTGLALQLEAADALLESNADPERVQQTVRQALALTRKNLEETRRSVYDLRAAPLEGRTLPEALAALAADWTAQGNPPVDVRVTGESRPLPVRIENGLYRIAQEALTNIGRHASARCVALALETVPERIRLVIEDNGQGFDAGDVGTPDQERSERDPGGGSGRYGLIGLNERAKLLGGTLRLESSPGTGTRIEIQIPLGNKR